MPFVQVIEFSTTELDEIRALVEEYRSSTEGSRAATRGMLCADRDQPGRYLNIVEFDSYEEAMRNSELPETTAFAKQMTELCDGPPSFRNLDVTERFDA